MRSCRTRRITDFFDDEVLNSNFWLYWRTMFAFENWHSALEMKLYIQRYIHHIGGLPDFKALRFTKYNQYESMILPDGQVPGRASASSSTTASRWSTWSSTCTSPATSWPSASTVIREGKKEAIDLTENDLVFITNGGCVENSTMGSQNEPAAVQHRDQSRAAAGICGARSPRRTRPSAIPTSSAMTPSRPTG